MNGVVLVWSGRRREAAGTQHRCQPPARGSTSRDGPVATGVGGLARSTRAAALNAGRSQPLGSAVGDPVRSFRSLGADGFPAPLLWSNIGEGFGKRPPVACGVLGGELPFAVLEVGRFQQNPCAVGPGTLAVGGATGSSTVPGSPLLWLTLTLVATAGALYLAKRRTSAATTKQKSAATTARPVLLGLTAVQLILTVGGIAIALIVGLALGGFFS